MSDGGSDGGGGAGADSPSGHQRALSLLLFALLLLVAIMVVLTCIWKVVKLIALYKMESRIEELEQLSGGADLGEAMASVSPGEARTLRRLLRASVL